VRLLLDTHAVLWWLADDPVLSREARGAIRSADEVLFSAASMWEIAIKRARGQLVAPEDIGPRLRDGGVSELPIRWEHATYAGALPRHHGDPFDRMLVAQALIDGLTIVTRDGTIAAYGVRVVHA
jgi:PIN domain nuclease of toxin-antitoxin system